MFAENGEVNKCPASNKGPLSRFKQFEKQRALNPLQANISMDILYTGLYTFPNVLARRTCSSVNYHFPYSHDLDV